MNQLNLFFDLIRIKRPIGFMLLFWPCAWGLTISYKFSENNDIYFYYLILFLLGAILMRSAGCIINDIADKNFDKKVSRTKNRPIASGKVSVILGYFYSFSLCLVALIVLLQFNNLTILLALLSMPLAFSYPLMKRFTYWPQLFLGITFNYGLILGWVSINNEISITPFIFYIGAIFWTLGYDTIYGYQDLKDDEIIGVKSTSIKFKSNPFFILKLCYSIFLVCLIITGLLLQLNQFYFLFLLIIAIQMFYFQINKLDINNEINCLKIFKSNNLVGFLIYLNLLIGKF
ncbi:4-hydroxybenzoate octaprenyltransferase [Candidatus Pelagibacter sp.]|nr:4-hydroxybenzoate octaprenyltransferase [Candidatus Pelagibacter sp.]